MKRKNGFLTLLLSLGSLLTFGVYANPITTDSINHVSPEEVIDFIYDKANEDRRVQQTKLDGINNKGRYGKYQITNTLEWIRTNIQPYLQWMIFLGLIGATILIIRNGFRLVTGTAKEGSGMKNIKENIKNILIGVLIMTGFWAIIELVVAIVNMLFGK